MAEVGNSISPSPDRLAGQQPQPVLDRSPPSPQKLKWETCPKLRTNHWARHKTTNMTEERQEGRAGGSSLAALCVVGTLVQGARQG